MFQEGPHCAIKEDEFFDAVDASLDKLEKEEESVSLTNWVINRLIDRFAYSAHLRRYFSRDSREREREGKVKIDKSKKTLKAFQILTCHKHSMNYYSCMWTWLYSAPINDRGKSVV